jgi:uncharacterized protein YjiS (DUF1127 family)
MAHVDALGARTAPRFFYSRLPEVVRSAWAGYWVRRAERATIFALHALDDRTLKDIGMDRSEIESVVYARARDRFQSSGRRITMCVRA